MQKDSEQTDAQNSGISLPSSRTLGIAGVAARLLIAVAWWSAISDDDEAVSQLDGKVWADYPVRQCVYEYRTDHGRRERINHSTNPEPCC